MKPTRIRQSRSKGWILPFKTVVVSTPGPWENPYVIGQTYPDDGYPNPISRQQAVDAFRKWINSGSLAAKLARVKVRKDLRGKNLACLCAPGQPCHADVLLDVANSKERL